jgi:hypothetical protein
MRELIKATVEVLKCKINANLEDISKNEVKFKELLKTAESPERQVELRKIIDINKNKLSENFDFINLQVTFLNFLEKYKHHSILMGSGIDVDSNPEETQEEFVPQPEDYFDYTIAGKIPFNEQHPCFSDGEFFSKLLKHYEEREDYEKCAELIQIKKE